MSTNDKYLVLRGKNKDIYFIQKRVSKKISSIIGKEFIKKSLETNDIDIARTRRDKILEELKTIEITNANNNVRTDISSFDLSLEPDVPTNSQNKAKDILNYRDLSHNYRKDIENVPINNNISQEIKDESDGYFSFIDYSKLPKKEDISRIFDKILPLVLIFLAIFIALLV